MEAATFNDIWERTLGQTLSITEKDSLFTTGLSESTSLKYQQSADLSDDQIASLIGSGKL